MGNRLVAVTDYPELEAQLDKLRTEWSTHAVVSVLAELARTDAMDAAMRDKRVRSVIFTAVAKGLDQVAYLLESLPHVS